MKYNFEDFLRSDCCEYEGILDDDMPDAFDAWISDIDTQEVMDYADKYAENILKQLKEIVQEYTNPKPEFDGITWDMIISKIK